jgi:hypothetical protein
MNKKFIAGLLTVSMLAVSAIPSFASDGAKTEFTYEDLKEGVLISGNATTKEPTIEITVPCLADTFINPYHIDYTGDDVEVKDLLGDDVSTNGILGAKNTVSNNGDVAVDMSIEELKVNSGAYDTKYKSFPITVSSKNVKSTNTGNKSMYLYMEIKDTAGSIKKVVATQNAKWAKVNGSFTEKALAGGKLKKPVTIAANKSVSFQFKGNVNANPTRTEYDSDGKKVKVDGKVKTEGNLWNAETDQPIVSYKIKFTPKSN